MFIGRRRDGTVYGAWANQQPEDSDHPGIEEVDDDNPDLVEFRKPHLVYPKIDKAILDAVLNDPQVPDSLKALLNVLPDTKAAAAGEATAAVDAALES